LKERLDWAKLLAVALSLAGCVMVSSAWQPAAWRTDLFGILTGLFSGLGYAVYSLMGRSASKRGLNPWTTLLYTFGFATLFLLLFNFVPDRLLPGTATRPANFFWLGDALAGWSILFLLAAVPTVAGFGLYNVSLGYLPSSVANLIATMEPAFTSVVAYVLLGERFSGIQIGGSLILLTGVVLLRVYDGWLASRALTKPLSQM
jgi:drug/metabolite transporter (DMT)-like permease